ncbi:MAG: hypothetical protein GYB67_02765 [Chloroflexi bacterium]|nr:hypothetical protein [Chloroflexota bacterium]
MSLQLHRNAREHLKEQLDDIHASVVDVAQNIAKNQGHDVVSASHIDEALNVLRPPRRRQRVRYWAGLGAGTSLGIAGSALVGLFQSLIAQNTDPALLFGIGFAIVAGVLGLMLAYFAST